MKKLFVVMFAAAAFAACNDNTKSEEARSADSNAAAPMTASPDSSAAHMDTTAVPLGDSSKPKM